MPNVPRRILLRIAAVFIAFVGIAAAGVAIGLILASVASAKRSRVGIGG